MFVFSPLSNVMQAQAKRSTMWRRPDFFFISLILHFWGKKEGLGKKGQKPLGWLALLVPFCILCKVDTQNIGSLMAHTCELWWRIEGVFLTCISLTGKLLSGLLLSGSLISLVQLIATVKVLTRLAALLVWVPKRCLHSGYCKQCLAYPPKVGHPSFLPMKQCCSTECFAAMPSFHLTLTYFSFLAWQNTKCCKPTA